MSIPHSSDRPCRKVAGQTRGSLRTALAGSALAVAALFGTVALVQPAPVHAQAVRQLPEFKPGRQNGCPVAVAFTAPLLFGM